MPETPAKFFIRATNVDFAAFSVSVTARVPATICSRYLTRMEMWNQSRIDSTGKGSRLAMVCRSFAPSIMPRRYILQDQAARVTRFLEDISGRPDAMLRETACEQEHYLGVRWLISLLYLLSLRISEVLSSPSDEVKRAPDELSLRGTIARNLGQPRATV